VRQQREISVEKQVRPRNPGIHRTRGADLEQQIIKTYTGRHEGSIEKFKADAEMMAVNGYYPMSQVWVPGSYGTAEFILALLQCIILIGFLTLAYMLIVKPEGKLVVTYMHRSTLATASPSAPDPRPARDA
jgi:hypothetical protein